MKKEFIISVLVGLVLGIFISPLFFDGSDDNYMMRNRPDNYDQQNMLMLQMSEGLDQHFIEQMISHHKDAILMAEVALTRAEHPEIKELAQNIKQTQTEENTKMREWYKSWFEKDVPENLPNSTAETGQGTMMHGGMTGNDTDTELLKTAKPFDKEFIRQMIPHHQMAVMMANMVLTASIRPQIQQLAREIISAQTKEINDMRVWYNSWY